LSGWYAGSSESKLLINPYSQILLNPSILTLSLPQHLWFLLDLATNNQRTLAIRSPTYFPNASLLCLTHLFLKLDMHLTDPIGRISPRNHPDTWRFPPEFAGKGFVGSHLRSTLLAERSLTPLWRVLRGWTWDPKEPAVHMDKLDIVKLWARHYFNPEERGEDLDPRARNQTVLGIPFSQLGTIQMEGFGQLQYKVDHAVLNEMVSLEEDATWGPVIGASVTPLRPVRQATKRKPEKLVRVDQLVMREGVRREMGMWEHWVRMMVWGWVDPVGRTLPIWTERDMLRMRKGLRPVDWVGGKKAEEDDG
jgi:hypothetical protein